MRNQGAFRAGSRRGFNSLDDFRGGGGEGRFNGRKREWN